MARKKKRTKTVKRKGRVSRVKRGAKTHPGFKSVQRKIAKKYGMKRAGAILASATRKASKKAKRTNPRLKRVRNKKRRRK